MARRESPPPFSRFALASALVVIGLVAGGWGAYCYLKRQQPITSLPPSENVQAELIRLKSLVQQTQTDLQILKESAAKSSDASLTQNRLNDLAISDALVKRHARVVGNSVLVNLNYSKYYQVIETFTLPRSFWDRFVPSMKMIQDDIWELAWKQFPEENHHVQLTISPLRDIRLSAQSRDEKLVQEMNGAAPLRDLDTNPPQCGKGLQTLDAAIGNFMALFPADDWSKPCDVVETRILKGKDAAYRYVNGEPETIPLAAYVYDRSKNTIPTDPNQATRRSDVVVAIMKSEFTNSDQAIHGSATENPGTLMFWQYIWAGRGSFSEIGMDEQDALMKDLRTVVDQSIKTITPRASCGYGDCY